MFTSETFIDILFSPYDKENANLIDANVTKEILVTGYVEKMLYLNRFLPKYCEDGLKVSQAHENGFIHLHDLKYALTRANCLQHPIDLVFKYGLKALSCVSNPAKHLGTAFSHAVNSIAISQGHQCGGQAISLFNVFLAPYAHGLTYSEIKQAVQSFVYQLNQINPSRGFQSAFSSVNCEFHIPKFLENETIEYGPQKGNQFGDFEDEARLILQALIEVLMEKDADGKPFLFPNTITVIRDNVTPDDELLQKVIQCNLETNNTYYLNMLQYGNKLANAMGCVDGKEVVIYKYKDQLYVESFERMWKRFESFGVKTWGISEYVEVPDLEIYDSVNGFVKVKRIIRNPDKSDWMFIKFDNGRSLLVTSDHPLPTKNGVKQTIDLQISDEVPAIYEYTLPETKKVDVDFAYLLGLLIRDGNKDLTLSVGIDEEELADEFIKIVEKLSNGTLTGKKHYRKWKGKNSWIDVNLISNGERGERTQFIKQIYNIFEGTKKADIHIPNEVFSWTREAKCAFIAGMIDADGYITSRTETTRVLLGTTNKEMSIQCMILVQSLGVPVKMYINHYTKTDKSKLKYGLEFPLTEEIVQHMRCKKKVQKFAKTGTLRTNDYVKVKEIVHIGHRGEYSYDVETESGYFDVSGIYSHNCRTWLDDSFTGNYLLDAMGSGNFEYGTINLPRVALLHLQTGRPIEEILREAVELIFKGLLVRRKIIWQRFLNGEYPFYTAYYEEGRGYYYNIPYTTMSVGFVGMYEFLKILQWDPKERIKVYEVLTQTLNELKQKTYEEIAEELKVDYKSPVEEYTRPSLIATPAEGCSYRLRMKDNELFGRKMVARLVGNDNPYYVNSDHLPEWEQVHVMKKIKYEELGHQYCNGGNISHLWLTDDVNSIDYGQLAQFVVNTCHKTKLRYFSFNPVIVYCKDCKKTYIGNQSEVNCKFCNSPNITYYSKVTGYVSETSRWNPGKKAEFRNRRSVILD